MEVMQKLEEIIEKYRIPKRQRYKINDKYLERKYMGYNIYHSLNYAENYARRLNKINKIKKIGFAVGLLWALKIAGAYTLTQIPACNEKYEMLKENIEYKINGYQTDRMIKRIQKDAQYQK